MQGGTFTISNGGTFGSLMGTPIINPPQSAILGMHSIVNRPVVRGTEIVARPMMYLALTYDHRLLDGKDAVLFLKKIQTHVQDPRRMLFDIWSMNIYFILTIFAYLHFDDILYLKRMQEMIINQYFFLVTIS